VFAIAVGVFLGGYWLFHWGYYFAKGAPMSLIDDISPARRPTALAALAYMQTAEATNAGGATAAEVATAGSKTNPIAPAGNENVQSQVGANPGAG